MRRIALRLLSIVAPARAARLAERLWFSIRRLEPGDEARAFLQTGRPFELSIDGSPVAGWSWGNGPSVLLLHGWGGYGAQLRGFVQPLVDSGFEAVIIDAPSHGASGPGRSGPGQATLFDFSDAILELARTRSDLAGVIAHSGACAAVAWTLARNSDFRPRRMVFVAPFASPARYMRVFQSHLGFSDGVMARFRSSAERRFGFRWEDFEVPGMASRMTPPPTLIYHDRNDRETAWQDGADIAASWPDARLETTTGLGHNRILRDLTVITGAVAFLSQLSGASGPPPPSAA